MEHLDVVGRQAIWRQSCKLVARSVAGRVADEKTYELTE